MTAPMQSKSATITLSAWGLFTRSYGIVLSNLGFLVRTSWLWFLVITVVAAGAYALSITLGEFSHPLATVGALFMTSAIDVVLFASLAVLWHRLVLKGERPGGFTYLRFDSTVVRYCALGLIFVALQWGLMAPAFLADETETATIVRIALILASVVGTIISTIIGIRYGLVLPAAAVQEPLSFSQSWRATAGHGWRIFGAMLLASIPLIVVGLAVGIGLESAGIPSGWPTYLSNGVQSAVLAVLLLPFVTMLSELYRLLVVEPAKTFAD